MLNFCLYLNRTKLHFCVAKNCCLPDLYNGRGCVPTLWKLHVHVFLEGDGEGQIIELNPLILKHLISTVDSFCVGTSTYLQ